MAIEVAAAEQASPFGSAAYVEFVNIGTPPPRGYRLIQNVEVLPKAKPITRLDGGGTPPPRGYRLIQNVEVLPKAKSITRLDSGGTPQGNFINKRRFEYGRLQQHSAKNY